jgi:hypothetical protein
MCTRDPRFLPTLAAGTMDSVFEEAVRSNPQVRAALRSRPRARSLARLLPRVRSAWCVWVYFKVTQHGVCVCLCLSLALPAHALAHF